MIIDEDDNGGPAFPVTTEIQVYSAGMSLRDWFAGQALASVFQDSAFEKDDHYEALAVEIFKMADAMIAARGQK